MTHDDICEVASRITGVPPSVIRSLKMPDYLDVSGVVGGFFDPSPPTGGKD